MKDPRDSGKRKLTIDTVAAAGRRRGTEAIAHPDEERADATARHDAERREAELSLLFLDDEERDFRTRWKVVQTGFVDEPRQAVEQADELIAKLLQRLAESCSEQRSGLEKQWEKSQSASTKDLRLALRRYRSFFDRLLSI
jgi:hypothetical protein